MRPHIVHLAASVLLAGIPGAQAQTLSALPDSTALRVDRVFSAFTHETPGCVVGIAQNGRPVYTRAFGMANLEYGVPLTDQSVMESGSVAKQFTAGAIVLLALDGKLSLEDDIRKYIPEVPLFDGQRITLRMLLNHTSGLRDQWGLLGIAGEPPGVRVHSPATTIDLVAHQKMLNFPAGSQYLYSNTGYALLGVVVQRVSGKSLDAFTHDRLFAPLGMSQTQWRDDFREVVKNRATGYSGTGATARTDMPFTNMIGNGGLLFTIGDMLKWLENLDNPMVGGRAWRDSLQVRGRLTSGKPIAYALGLTYANYQGLGEIAHSGSTAGYQTWVGRYPEQHTALAVLCNTTAANPTALAHQVVDIVLPHRISVSDVKQAAAVALAPAELNRWAGIYRVPSTDQVIQLFVRNGAVSTTSTGTPALVTTATTRAHVGTTEYLLVASPANRRLAAIRGEDTLTFDVVAPADTGAKAMAEYVGTYASDELDVKLVVAKSGAMLTLRRRPADIGPMLPVYKDDFSAPVVGGTIRFTRDASGTVTGFSIFAGRVLDVRFKKISSDTTL